ncbi:hypothetical protein GOV07_05665, partial [Candidatus Woesearchaeota archaeon]|nr:hypothetical protein [Candidatus Woesearchaeota archaeon]
EVTKDDESSVIKEEESNLAKIILWGTIITALLFLVIFLVLQQLKPKSPEGVEEDGAYNALHAYIHKMRENGGSDERIKEGLLRTGWDEDIIDRELMEDNLGKLGEYITDLRKQGLADLQIKEQLILAGWPRNLIEVEMKRL